MQEQSQMTFSEFKTNSTENLVIITDEKLELRLEDIPFAIKNLRFPYLKKLSIKGRGPCHCTSTRGKAIEPEYLAKIFSNTPHLQWLTLTSCLDDIFPPEIWKLKSLTCLELYRNSLKTLPKEIGNLKNLKWFFVELNHLESLPDELWTLNKLTKLELCFNTLKSISKDI